MGAHRAWRDLQFERAVGHAIVMADLPLLLDAQDLVGADAGNGGEGRAFAGRQNRKTGVVGGQVDLAKEGVRRLDIGYAGERKLVDEPILRRRTYVETQLALTLENGDIVLMDNLPGRRLA